MRNKISIISCRVAFLMVAVLAVSSITSRAQTQSMEEKISEFIYSDEFKAPEIAKLKSLPKEAVVVLAEILNKKKVSETDELRIYKCLASKFIQHEDELSASERDIATDALLSKLGGTYLPDRSFRVNALKGVKSPQLLRIIQGETNAKPRTETNQSIDAASSPKDSASVLSAKPTASPLAATSNQKTEPMVSPTPLQSSTAAKTISTRRPWIIGAILLLAVVGGILLKLRRK